jgi:predicted dehydrogenase/nucleoside-diphosphate-sugar epimerase
MKILVTGASGFLGRHILQKLSDEGTDIVALVRRTSRTEHLQSYSVHFIQGNVRDKEALRRAMKGVDVVIHAACDMLGGWDDFYKGNVESTRDLLELSKNQKIRRFVYISSIDVYDHAHTKNGSILSEEDPRDPNPSNFYSRSKIEAEEIVEEYQTRYGVPTVIIRPGCIYGPGGNWYPARLGFSAGSGRYALLGNGKSAVPMSHTSSVTDLIWRSIQNENAVGKSYNIVEDEEVTRLGFLETTREILTPELKIIRIPIPIAKFMAFGMRTALKLIGKPAPTRIHPLYMRLFSQSIYYANDRAKQGLGWKPVSDVQGTIEAMLRWHRDRKDKPRSEMLIPELPVEISESRVLNVGLVGCGAFAPIHLKTIKGIDQAKVIGVCDPDTEKADALVKKWKIPHVYSNLTELLENESPDVIHIISPTQTHSELAIQAMKKGCHVLVEKPFAVNAKEASNMIRISQEEKVVLCAEHTLLYHPAMIKVRKLIQKGSIGDILQVNGWFGTDFSTNIGAPFLRYDARNSWMYQLPGGLFQDFIPHPLSVVLDVMSEVEEIRAFSKDLKIVPYMKADELRIQLENQSILGDITLSFGASPRHNFLHVYGTRGSIWADFIGGSALLFQDMGMLPKAIGRNLLIRKHGKEMRKISRKNLGQVIRGTHFISFGYETLFRLFYRSIFTGEKVPVSTRNILNCMKIMDKVWDQVTLM